MVPSARPRGSARSSTLVARVVSSRRDTWSDLPARRVSRNPREGQRVAEDGEQRDEDGGGQPDLEDVEPEGGSRDVVDAGPDGGDPVRCRWASPAIREPRPMRKRAVTAPERVAGAKRIHRGSKRTSSVSVSMVATCRSPAAVPTRASSPAAGARCRSSARRVEAASRRSRRNVRRRLAIGRAGSDLDLDQSQHPLQRMRAHIDGAGPDHGGP